MAYLAVLSHSVSQESNHSYSTKESSCPEELKLICEVRDHVLFNRGHFPPILSMALTVL